jgi:hypothetical protein
MPKINVLKKSLLKLNKIENDQSIDAVAWEN